MQLCSSFHRWPAARLRLSRLDKSAAPTDIVLSPTSIATVQAAQSSLFLPLFTCPKTRLTITVQLFRSGDLKSLNLTFLNLCGLWSNPPITAPSDFAEAYRRSKSFAFSKEQLCFSA